MQFEPGAEGLSQGSVSAARVAAAQEAQELEPRSAVRSLLSRVEEAGIAAKCAVDFWVEDPVGECSP